MKVIMKNGEIMESSFGEEVGRNALRHTAAHVLAQAVKRLYPETKCAIGPAIENGFYYDFEFGFEFTSEKLLEIEAEMKRIVKEALPIKHYILSRADAIREMEERQEFYKLEMVAEMPENAQISFFRQGEYVEMCAGQHVLNTSLVKAVKLTSLAGAYWRGDEKNRMLTRIYGTAYPKQSDLDEYIEKQEEAKARDHRKIGKELGLFVLMEEGPGFPFFLPKGMVLKNLLLDYWRKVHEREGYVEISTPIMLRRELWEVSGHWANYRESMYTTEIDNVDFAVKPMNCPGGMLVYKMQPHSYKELPIRMGELGLVHRHEKSGTLHGLMRVRCFTQDDAHIFMMREQVTEEIKGVVRLIDEVYRKFGFKYHVELSTRPEKSIGCDEDWNEAIEALKQALEEMELPYAINEGDGAFYGPKIDFHLEDSIGRTWQCGTIQLDFQLPQRFHAEFIGADGEKHQPIMIHRVVFGSIERFIGILIEHYAGKFPVWLAPVQVKVLPISSAFLQYATTVTDRLKAAGVRCELDTRDEKLGYKIREARLDKVPYMVVIGKKEQDDNIISVRGREEGDIGSMSVEEFVRRVLNESYDCTNC
ncbi:MAG TPA: threonine--tRNA ligase [Lachnospiraceae bacterium]|nr:threonine--tRNA ligase [Lachnospiraceae bacterium]